MRRLRTAETLGLIAGFAIWCSAFVSLYALHGWACGSGLPLGSGTVRAALAGVFALHLAAHVGLSVWLYRRMKADAERPAVFLKRASFVLSIAAAGATVWTSAPILFLEIC